MAELGTSTERQRSGRAGGYAESGKSSHPLTDRGNPCRAEKSDGEEQRDGFVGIGKRRDGEQEFTRLFQFRHSPNRPLYHFFKRALDIAVSSTVLLGGLPVWALIALLVKLTSDGPVIYKQYRAGLHGRPFMMYKFRTMETGADARLEEHVDPHDLDERVFNLGGDPRVTPVGRVLRRSGLDEIPQLVNVLKGEMSLVGPRPEEVRMTESYDAWRRTRLRVKPGLTGLQQARCRQIGSHAQRVHLDRYYIDHQSLLLDAYILLETVPVVLKGAFSLFTRRDR